MVSASDIAPHMAFPEQALQTLSELCSVEPDLKQLSHPQEMALLKVLGNSDFLSRWGRRFPKSVLDCLRDAGGEPFYLPKLLNEWNNIISSQSTLSAEALTAQLVHFKYRHFFRIALRDLALQKPFPSVVAEITDLAKAVVQIAYHWQRNALEAEWGKVLFDGQPRKAMPFLALGMGKMGGNELNFSSDLDLIYAYQSDLAAYERKLNQEFSPREFFGKLAERLTRFLSQKTSEGFLYRIDLELRPEGKSGALVHSLEGMESYYENFGAPWERQAMLKSSFAAGDPELFDAFWKMIHPFVYPRHTDYSFLDNLKIIKAKIIAVIQNSPRKSFHVKLGDGGIRELEFFVQSLQVLFGGKISNLQVTNTLLALTRLQHNRFISEAEREKLEAAYIFLRNMEHRLQLVDEQQTHQFPESPEDIRHLARRMGYTQDSQEAAVEKMMEDLAGHRKSIKTAFEDLLSDRYRE